MLAKQALDFLHFPGCSASLENLFCLGRAAILGSGVAFQPLHACEASSNR
jgi:hypothetical protein